jgi:cell division protein FtsB
MERPASEQPSPSVMPSGTPARGSAHDPKGPGRSEPADASEATPSPAPLDSLPIAGITRRRVAFVLAAFVCVWIVVVFARQVGEASAAAVRAQRMTTGNAQLSATVAALQRELELINRSDYVAQQARGVGLGASNERPFSLAPGAPRLPANAPGSAAVRLGSHEERQSPLEEWLSLLFGPSPSQ